MRSQKSPLRKAAWLRSSRNLDDESLRTAFNDDDPFIRQAARRSFAGSENGDAHGVWKGAKTDRQREEVAILLRQRDGDRDRQVIERLLDDPSPRVKWIAVQWIGESKLDMFQTQLEERLVHGEFSGDLLDACLASLHLLKGGTPSEYEAHDEELLAELVSQRHAPAPVLRYALRRLPPDHPSLNGMRWFELVMNVDAMCNSKPSVRCANKRRSIAKTCYEKSPWTGVSSWRRVVKRSPVFLPTILSRATSCFMPPVRRNRVLPVRRCAVSRFETLRGRRTRTRTCHQRRKAARLASSRY